MFGWMGSSRLRTQITHQETGPILPLPSKVTFVRFRLWKMVSLLELLFRPVAG